MIRIRELRFWTALLVVGLAAIAMSSALPTLGFGVAELFADANSADTRLAPFLDDASVGALARSEMLTLASDKSAAARAAALSALLSMTPLASGAWLDLAIAWRRAGAPMNRIASALALSALSGPNEGRFMAGRAAFGLPLWSGLPPDVRRSLIGDLVGGWSQIDEARRRAIDAVLTAESDAAREEIRADLLLAGKAGSSIADALELAPQEASRPSPQ